MLGQESVVLSVEQKEALMHRYPILRKLYCSGIDIISLNETGDRINIFVNVPRPEYGDMSFPITLFTGSSD